jgi:hypothetical protein
VTHKRRGSHKLIKKSKNSTLAECQHQQNTFSPVLNKTVLEHSFSEPSRTWLDLEGGLGVGQGRRGATVFSTRKQDLIAFFFHFFDSSTSSFVRPPPTHDIRARDQHVKDHSGGTRKKEKASFLYIFASF